MMRPSYKNVEDDLSIWTDNASSNIKKRPFHIIDQVIHVFEENYTEAIDVSCECFLFKEH